MNYKFLFCEAFSVQYSRRVS